MGDCSTNVCPAPDLANTARPGQHAPVRATLANPNPNKPPTITTITMGLDPVDPLGSAGKSVRNQMNPAGKMRPLAPEGPHLLFA